MSVDVPVTETLRELLATSERLESAAQDGNAEGVSSTLTERAKLIAKLPSTLSPEAVEEHALLERIMERDGTALRRLEEWRVRLGGELNGLGTARAAAAGYARVAAVNPAVIDRDL